MSRPAYLEDFMKTDDFKRLSQLKYKAKKGYLINDLGKKCKIIKTLEDGSHEIKGNIDDNMMARYYFNNKKQRFYARWSDYTNLCLVEPENVAFFKKPLPGTEHLPHTIYQGTDEFESSTVKRTCLMCGDGQYWG